MLIYNFLEKVANGANHTGDAGLWRQAKLESVILHEVITDMSLALNLDWLFHSFVSYLSKKGITPGFNTRNFPYLVQKFREWNIDLEKTVPARTISAIGYPKLYSPSCP